MTSPAVARTARLRAELPSLGADAMLVTADQNRRYLTGFTGSAGVAMVSASAAILGTDFRYWEQAQQQAPSYDLYRMKEGLSKALPELATAAGARTIAFEAGTLTYTQWQALDTVARDAGLTLVPTTDVIERLRAIKDASEIADIQAAIDLADEAVTYVASELRPGMTERQAAWIIEKYIREHGGDGLSFETIVGAGPNGALPHWRPTETVIEAGDPIVFDLGALVRGYCSDLTRTIFLGQPNDRFKEIYSIVLEAQLTAEDGARAGMAAKDVDGLARDVIAKAGYGDYFGHGTGHGVGLEIHEAPRVSSLSDATMEEGMVFTVEPGIYLPGEFGVRIEDMAVIENGRARVLSRAAKYDFGG